MAKSSSRPLSDHEYDLLARVLDIESPLDIDGYLGLLHAVVVAPGQVPPSTWLPAVFPNGFEALGEEAAKGSVDLLLRLYNEVVDAVNARRPLMPAEHEVDACVSFAKGYLMGAQLDPTWVEDDARWTFASWAAYLAGENDFVAPKNLREFEERPDETRAMLREQMGAIVMAAYDSFIAQDGGGDPATAATSARKVGSNDPCPCGSGKKFKKCCVDVRAQAG